MKLVKLPMMTALFLAATVQFSFAAVGPDAPQGVRVADGSSASAPYGLKCEWDGDIKKPEVSHTITPAAPSSTGGGEGTGTSAI